MKKVLSIAGSDCSGGAGIQADLKTFAAHGVYGMTVISSITAQNTQKIKAVEDVSEKMLQSQIDAIFEDMIVDSVKIGMINSLKNAQIIYDKLLYYKAKNIVLDPVIISTTGKELLKEDAKYFLITKLFKVVDLICPNLNETEEILRIILKLDINYQRDFKETFLAFQKIDSIEKMIIAGKIISNFTKKWVLVKGGHLNNEAVDILVKGDIVHTFFEEKINTLNTHGTGCTLSSSIAANLAKGLPIKEAVKKAKKFTFLSIKNSIDFGKINGPVNQMGEIYNNINLDKIY